MELRREGRWSISSRGAAASPARAPRTISPRPRGYDHSPSRAALEARSKPSPKRRRRSASPRRRSASPRKKRSSRARRSAQRRSPARSARRSGHEPGAAEAAEVPTVSAPRTPIGLPELVRLPPKQRRRNRSAGSLTRLHWRSQVRDTIHHCAQWVAEHGPELEERIRTEKGEGGNSDLWRFLFEDPRRSTAARCVPLRAAGPAPKNIRRDQLYVYSAGTTSSSCGTGTSWSGRSSRAPQARPPRGAKPRRSARARRRPSPAAARRSAPAASRRPLARRCSATCTKTPWPRWRRRSS